MAHIVCLTSGLTGILNASFEMVSRLMAAGHQVTYASPAEVGKQVCAQGIPYVQLPPPALSPEPDLPSFSGPFRKWQRWSYKISHRKLRLRLALEALGQVSIDKQLEKLAPDLLIIDVELHEYIITAYAKKLPLVLLSQWFSLWKSPGLPYLLHDIIPGKGWKGNRIAIEMDWLLVKLRRKWMFTKKKWLSAGTDRRSTLLELARCVNFPLAFIKENYWPGPFSYRSLPVISMTAWEMEFPHKKREQLHYVGPMVYDQRIDTAIDQDLQEQLAVILEQKRKNNSTLIYCSVSSLKSGDQAFLRKVCEAVDGEQDWILLLGMGGLLSRDFLEPVPGNVYPFPWLPQLQILAQADCSINHGGIHTIHECIHFKVPMLVYSGKRSDQNGCAARVAYHHLGLTGDKDADSAATINRKIKQVLSEQAIRNNLEQMHQHFTRYKTENCLEALIGNYCAEC